MIWAVVLLVLAVIGIGGFAFFGAIGLLARDEKGRKTALANSERLLDGAFDGSKHVTYESTPRTLPVSAVVIGAEERGYRLLSQDEAPGQRVTLAFKKKASSAGRARTRPASRP